METGTISTLLLILLLVAWIGYSAFRISSYLKNRSKTWGEVVAFVIFFSGSLLLEVLLIRH